MALEIITSVITIGTLLAKLGRFVHEAQGATQSKDDLFAKVTGLHELLVVVAVTLSKRNKQKGTKAINADEENLLIALSNALARCKQTVKQLEQRLRGLDGGSGPGWLRRLVLQGKLNIKSDEFTRLGTKIDVNIASLQVLLPCFQPFMHEETQTILRAGNQKTERYLSEIRQEVHRVRRCLESLSQELHPVDASAATPPARRDIGGLPAVKMALEDGDALEDQRANLQTMKTCVDTADNFVDRISKCGSVVGQSTSDPLSPIGSNYEKSWRGFSIRIDEHNLEEARTHDRAQSEDGGVPLNESANTVAHRSVFLTTGSFTTDGEHSVQAPTRRPSTLSLEHLTGLFDMYVRQAEVDLQSNRPENAESCLRKAIGRAELRERECGYPFDTRYEIQKMLAEAYVKQEKFDDAFKLLAAMEPYANLQPAKLAEYHYTVADLARLRYLRSGDDTLWGDCEEKAVQAYNSASSMEIASNPLVFQSLGILIQLNECIKDTVAVEYWRNCLGKSKAAPVSAEATFLQETPDAKAMPAIHTPVLERSPSSQATRTPTVFTKGPPSTSTISSQTISSQTTVDAMPSESQLSKALLVAATRGDVKDVELLLLVHANIEDRDAGGLTPLLIAAKHKRSDVVRYLLGRSNIKSDVNARDTHQRNVLHHALLGVGGEDMIQDIVDHAADVNAKDDQGRTPLHLCVHYNKRLAAQILIQNGADPNARDNSERSVIELAIDMKQSELAKQLYRAGAEVDPQTLPRDLREYLQPTLIIKKKKKEKKQDELSRASVDMDSRSLGGYPWSTHETTAKKKKKKDGDDARSLARQSTNGSTSSRTPSFFSRLRSNQS